MRLSVNKSVLLSGLQAVQNVIVTKTSLPILSNVLLEAQNEQLRLTATDLDIGITCVIPVDVREVGAITIPAKRFSDIVKELPEGKIQLMAKKNNQMNIEASSCQFRVMGLAREEFPKLPEFKDKEVISLEQKDLREMLQVTSFAASTDEHRYILNGVLFRFHKNTLTVVATDGKRLAVVEKKLNTPSNVEASIIVPQKTVQELGRNLKEEGNVSLVLGLNQALFELGFISIVSRLIEGEFPDYKQVIPLSTSNKLRLNRGEFLLAVKRAALLSTPDYQAVKLEVFKIYS
jgi:DNA polymerase III subunit beta